MKKATLKQFLLIGEMIQSGRIDYDLALAITEGRVVIEFQPETTPTENDDRFPYDLSTGYLELTMMFEDPDSRKPVVELPPVEEGEIDERAVLFTNESREVTFALCRCLPPPPDNNLYDLVEKGLFRTPTRNEFRAFTDYYFEVIRGIGFLLAPSACAPEPSGQGEVAVSVEDGRLVYESYGADAARMLVDSWTLFVTSA